MIHNKRTKNQVKKRQKSTKDIIYLK